ncbi:MAG: hypothetical protein KDD85_04095 [Parvularculaceae bacterium]|nr:hypothetical protein [Parvularculaceae bacterium]
MRSSVHRLFTAAASIALAACGKGEIEPEPAPEKPVREISEVAAADAFGTPGETVNAVAFWSHPSVNFESLLVAGGDKGLTAYNIESGEKISAAAQGPVDALSVFYSGSGAQARAYVIAGTNDRYEFYSVDNVTRALSPAPLANDAMRAGAFCAGRVGGAISLFEISKEGIAERRIETGENGVTLGNPQKIAPLNLRACHVDERAGDIVVISDDGALLRLDPKSGETFGLAFADAPPTSSALVLTTAPDQVQGGALALLDGETGVVSLFDLVDGHALGAVRVKATFDLEAVSSARAIGAGYGNYGGVYRDGALAIVTADGGAPIRLVPWNGVLGAISQPLGETVDPRAPQAADEDAPVIKIDLIEP